MAGRGDTYAGGGDTTGGDGTGGDGFTLLCVSIVTPVSIWGKSARDGLLICLQAGGASQNAQREPRMAAAYGSTALGCIQGAMELASNLQVHAISSTKPWDGKREKVQLTRTGTNLWA